MAKVKVVICPYCGDTQPAGDKCRVCGGLFEPLSRQASHNAMGPWFIRDETAPHHPGCSYETLVELVKRGRVSKYTIVRGPTTKQFWTVARRTAGLAHLLGYCHHCDAAVSKDDLGCHKCGAPFGAYLQRNYLGLPEIKPLPWETPSSGETDVWGGYYGVPRPHPAGVSSFGSDAELSTSTASRMSAALAQPQRGASNGESPAAARPGSTSRDTEPSLAALLDADESYYVATQRSLERRLAQQQRTSRMLLTLLIVTLIAALLTAFDVFRWGGPDGGDGQSSAGPTGVEDPTGAQEVENAQAGAGEEVSRDDTSPSPQPPAEQPAADDGATDPETAQQTPESEPNEVRPDPFGAEFARAKELIKQSASDALKLDDRIKRLGEAIQILKSIRDHAPEDQRPAGLPELIAAQEKQYRKLELKKFFP